jgi:TolA-binding protein
MDELEALAQELRRQLPPVPTTAISRQRARLFAVARGPSVRRSRALWAAILVSAVVASVACVVLLLEAERAKIASTVALDLVAQRAEIRHTLADGTIIDLAQGALGRVNDASSGAHFDLLRGTGTFSVAPQSGRAFTVQAGPYRVQVLGTKFRVRYESAGELEVLVEHGRVLVREPGREAVALGAGDRFSALRDERSVARRVDSAADARASGEAPPPAEAPPTIAAPTLRETAPSGSVGPDWYELYQRRDYVGALAAARVAGLPRLTEGLGAARLADLADAARLGGDLSASLQTLVALERRFPGSPQARHAGFLIGRVLAQSGRRSEASTKLEGYLAANPEGSYSLETMGRLMELYSERGDTARARAMAARYLERAPSGPYQRLARSLSASR